MPMRLLDVTKSLEWTVARWFALLGLISISLGLVAFPDPAATSSLDSRVGHVHLVGLLSLGVTANLAILGMIFRQLELESIRRSRTEGRLMLQQAAMSIQSGAEKFSRPTFKPSLPSPGEAFDRESALANLGGDEVLFVEILGIFLSDCPRILSEIEGTIERSDAVALRRLAHMVRGMAGYFGLESMVGAAGALEALAKAEAWNEARETFKELRSSFDRVLPTLETLVSASP